MTRRTPDLVQMVINDSDGHSCKVDLGVFWQAHSPVIMDIGPVLHPDDAVTGKMDALFNRWAPRDFLDIDAILSSHRYTRADLLAGAIEHNPGFDRQLFAESLSCLRGIPDRDFTPYGIDSIHSYRLHARAFRRLEARASFQARNVMDRLGSMPPGRQQK